MDCESICNHGLRSLMDCFRERLLQAAPAAGGVRRVDSEAKGWEMWTTYFAAGEVRVVPRT